MRIEIDTTTDGPLQYRAISAALLMLAGDIPEFNAEVPAGTVKASDVVTITGKPVSEVTTLRTSEEVRQFFGDVNTTATQATARPGKDANGNENGAWVPSEAHGGYVHTPAPLPSLRELQAEAAAGLPYPPPPPPPIAEPVHRMTHPNAALPPPPSNVVPFPPAPPAPGPAASAPVYHPSAGPTVASLVMSAPPGSPVLTGVIPTNVTDTTNAPNETPLPLPPLPVTAAPIASFPISATPVAQTPPATAAAQSSEVDRSGLPWDERIHQKGKSQKKDGTWKLKKGVDSAFAAQVVQELSARRVASHAGDVHNPAFGNLPPPPPPPPPDNGSATPLQTYTVPLPPAHNTVVSHGSVPLPPPPPVPSGVAMPPSQPTPVVQIPAPGAVPQPPTPPVNAAPGLATAARHKRLMDKLIAAVTDGKLDPKQVQPTVQKYGAPNLNTLGTPQYETLIPQIEAAFDQLIGA
jgi:hypothetical protein